MKAAFPFRYSVLARALSATSCLFLLAPALSVAEESGLLAAMKQGTTNLDMRYRYETVDQDNALDPAHASTLRTRLGYRTGRYSNTEFFLEFENTTSVGREHYNSTINGNTGRSVVADPTESEINQAYLSYVQPDMFTLMLGRQRLALDNHRFIGTVGWRQNEQTFDGAMLSATPMEKTKLTIGYLTQANRIFTKASPQGKFALQAPVVNVQYAGLPGGALTGYVYALDFSDINANSTQTVGLRFAGNTAMGEDLKALYTVEYASQSDYADNPGSFSIAYWLAEVGVAMGKTTLKAGMEVLGTDDGRAFQTPLATLHAMNGWTDQFLSTPANGLQDLSVKASTQFAGVKWLLVWHDFSSDEDSVDYGSEIGIQAVYPVNKSVKVGAKFASYSADEHNVDADKGWLWVDISI